MALAEWIFWMNHYHIKNKFGVILSTPSPPTAIKTLCHSWCHHVISHTRVIAKNTSASQGFQVLFQFSSLFANLDTEEFRARLQQKVIRFLKVLITLLGLCVQLSWILIATMIAIIWMKNGTLFRQIKKIAHETQEEECLLRILSWAMNLYTYWTHDSRWAAKKKNNGRASPYIPI